MSNIKNTKLLLVILAVLVGAGAFFGGMKYQESRGRNFAQENTGADHQGQQGGQFRRNQGQGFRPVNGEIISSDDTSITVKLPDGSSKIVLLSDKTTLNKATTASKSDVKIGQRVAVFGTENTDGSLTAQSIQLNPVIRGGAEDHVPSTVPKQ